MPVTATRFLAHRHQDDVVEVAGKQLAQLVGTRASDCADIRGRYGHRRIHPRVTTSVRPTAVLGRSGSVSQITCAISCADLRFIR